MNNSNHANSIRTAYSKGYRVTDAGEVLSPRGYVLVTTLGSTGYLRFSVKVRSSTGRHLVVSLYVHSLAKYQWFGEPSLYQDICLRHLDGNKLNNRRDNLVLGTYSDNAYDIPKDTRVARSVKAAATLRKLTDTQASELRRDREAGASYEQLMMKYNIAKSTVSYIVNRKTYSTATQ